MVRWLVERGVRRFDAIYTEPIRHAKGEETTFSDESVTTVKQIAGFEGNHIPDTSNDCLIIGSGYDDKLIAQVAESKALSRKVQIFGLPSLRANMYQENVLRAHRAVESVGAKLDTSADSYFAPANDPFVTAAKLREVVDRLDESKPIPR